MRGKDIKNKYIKEDEQDKVGIIVIEDNGHWWHLHEDERVPLDKNISVHIRDHNNELKDYRDDITHGIK